MLRQIFDRQTGRAPFAVSTFWLTFFLIKLDEVSIERNYLFSVRGISLLYIFMLVIFATLWIVAVSGRTFDLCISRWWIAPLLALWMIVLVVMTETRSRLLLLSCLTATLVIQLPLMLLRSRRTRAA
jgi:hypothetical protein